MELFLFGCHENCLAEHTCSWFCAGVFFIFLGYECLGIKLLDFVPFEELPGCMPKDCSVGTADPCGLSERAPLWLTGLHWPVLAPCHVPRAETAIVLSVF